MGPDIALLVAGLAATVIAADLLVRGAADLAAHLRVPAVLISLTIVAFGAAAPETAIAIRAAELPGAADIGLGAIVGANVANVFLVLGLPALLHPMSTQAPGLRPHALALLAAAALFCALAYGAGGLGRSSGALLLAAALLYVALMAGQVRRRGADPALRDAAHYEDRRHAPPRALLYVVVALVGLPLGAQLVVAHAAKLAVLAHVRQEVLSLTVVAFGAALPELATVAAAAFRKKADVAVGAAIGSNVFTLLAAGGAFGLAGGGAFSPAMRAFDLPMLIAGSSVLALFILARRDIGRGAGLAMAAAYLAFVVWVWTQQGSAS